MPIEKFITAKGTMSGKFIVRRIQPPQNDRCGYLKNIPVFIIESFFFPIYRHRSISSRTRNRLSQTKTSYYMRSSFSILHSAFDSHWTLRAFRNSVTFHVCPRVNCFCRRDVLKIRAQTRRPNTIERRRPGRSAPVLLATWIACVQFESVRYSLHMFSRSYEWT